MNTFSFTEELRPRVEKIISQYPQDRKRSAVIPLLDLAQRQKGWITKEIIDYIAGILLLPPIRVYEIATFYTMFRKERVGKYHVQVCTNIVCMLRGCDDILRACEDVLGLKSGQTDSNYEFTVSEVECAGACVNAPVIQVGDDYYEDLTYDTAVEILKSFKLGEIPKSGPQVDRQFAAPQGGLTTLNLKS